MKKRRDISSSDLERWIARGDGQGVGIKFKPWFKVGDLPSWGRSHIPMGLKVNRRHHFFSDKEYNHFLIAEYDPFVNDIREQYALLPIEETVEIAKTHNLRHPIDRFSKVKLVMTSDLVLTICPPDRPCYTVVKSVKDSSIHKLEGQRFRSQFGKLYIERVYWERRGALWQMVTEKDASRAKALNLAYCRRAVTAAELDWLLEYMPEFLDVFMHSWKTDRTLNQIIDLVSVNVGLDEDYCFNLFYRAVWLRKLPVDLEARKIAHNFPLAKLS